MRKKHITPPLKVTVEARRINDKAKSIVYQEQMQNEQDLNNSESQLESNSKEKEKQEKREKKSPKSSSTPESQSENLDSEQMISESMSESQEISSEQKQHQILIEKMKKKTQKNTHSQQKDKKTQKQPKPQMNFTDLLKGIVKKIQNQEKKSPPKQFSQNLGKRKQNQKSQSEKIPIPTIQNDDNNIKDIKANQTYKPKNFSEPFNILKALFLLNANFNAVAPEDLMQKYQTIKPSEFRHWPKHRQRLAVNGFISVEGTEGKIKLEKKGVKFITPKMHYKQRTSSQEREYEKNKGRGKRYRNKNVKPKNKQISRQQNENDSQNHNSFSNQKSKQRRGEQAKKIKQVKHQYFKDKKFEKYPKQILGSSKCADKVTMIINPNAFNSNYEFNEFLQLVRAENTFNFTFRQVFNDITFFWEVQGKQGKQGKVLDCFVKFVQGVKTDINNIKNAIAESKYCNAQLFILLIELKSEKQGEAKDKQKTKKQEKQQTREGRKLKQLSSLILQARTAGISVVKTQKTQQTLAYLRKVTSLLAKTIRNISQTGISINHYGPLQKLNQWMKLHKNNNLRRIIIKCLRRLRCMNIPSLKRIAEKLPTFSSMYHKLNKLDNNNERVRFLNWLLEKSSCNVEANRMLVGLMFLKDYSLYGQLKQAYAKSSDQPNMSKELNKQQQTYLQKKRSQVQEERKRDQRDPQSQSIQDESNNSQSSSEQKKQPVKQKQIQKRLQQIQKCGPKQIEEQKQKPIQGKKQKDQFGDEEIKKNLQKEKNGEKEKEKLKGKQEQEKEKQILKQKWRSLRGEKEKSKKQEALQLQRLKRTIVKYTDPLKQQKSHAMLYSYESDEEYITKN